MVYGEGAGPCPKCRAPSWFESDADGVVQRCMCGLMRFMEVDKNGIKILHRVNPTQLVIPAKGTKLSRCLGVIVASHPEPVRTSVVAEYMSVSAGEISPHLMVLEYRGLLKRDKNGRGVQGGSYWYLTTKAVELLNLK